MGPLASAFSDTLHSKEGAFNLYVSPVIIETFSREALSTPSIWGGSAAKVGRMGVHSTVSRPLKSPNLATQAPKDRF